MHPDMRLSLLSWDSFEAMLRAFKLDPDGSVSRNALLSLHPPTEDSFASRTHTLSRPQFFEALVRVAQHLFLEEGNGSLEAAAALLVNEKMVYGPASQPPAPLHSPRPRFTPPGRSFCFLVCCWPRFTCPARCACPLSERGSTMRWPRRSRQLPLRQLQRRPPNRQRALVCRRGRTWRPRPTGGKAAL